MVLRFSARQCEDDLWTVQKVGSVHGTSIERKQASSLQPLIPHTCDPSSILNQPRDLRKFDSRIPNLVPTLLVRQEAILVRASGVRSSFTI